MEEHEQQREALDPTEAAVPGDASAGALRRVRLLTTDDDVAEAMARAAEDEGRVEKNRPRRARRNTRARRRVESADRPVVSWADVVHGDGPLLGAVRAPTGRQAR